MKRGKNLSGFTLIEVLVAVVVIALGSLAVLAFHSSAIRGGSEADSLTVASFLAESQLELLRSLDFDEIEGAVKAMPSTAACFSGDVNPCASGASCYTECLTRTGDACTGENRATCFKRTTGLISQTPTSRSHAVNVTVQWRGPTSDHSVTYDSMISAFGFTQ